eukprot:6213220-Pleurochrysis_carterae.AAC.7
MKEKTWQIRVLTRPPLEAEAEPVARGRRGRAQPRGRAEIKCKAPVVIKVCVALCNRVRLFRFPIRALALEPAHRLHDSQADAEKDEAEDHRFERAPRPRLAVDECTHALRRSLRLDVRAGCRALAWLRLHVRLRDHVLLGRRVARLVRRVLLLLLHPLLEPCAEQPDRDPKEPGRKYAEYPRDQLAKYRVVPERRLATQIEQRDPQRVWHVLVVRRDALVGVVALDKVHGRGEDHPHHRRHEARHGEHVERHGQHVVEHRERLGVTLKLEQAQKQRRARGDGRRVEGYAGQLQRATLMR